MALEDPAAPAQKKGDGFDCVLAMCRMLSAVTGLCALLCVIAHAMAFFAEPGDPVVQVPAGSSNATMAQQPPVDFEEVHFRDHFVLQILRLYGVTMGIVLALIETEWKPLLKRMRALENWIVRGFAHLFLALYTLKLATASWTRDDFSWSVMLYREIAGLCLMACAGMYIVGGVLCVGQLKEARHKRQQERQKVKQDLESLEKQREDLKNLLAVYE